MADDDTDLAALRADVERLATRLCMWMPDTPAGAEHHEAASLLRRLLDRLARAETRAQAAEAVCEAAGLYENGGRWSDVTEALKEWERAARETQA